MKRRNNIDKASKAIFAICAVTVVVAIVGGIAIASSDLPLLAKIMLLR